MQKKALKNSEIKHCFAPQYESLSIKRLFEFCSLHPEVFEYFPEERDLPRLNRQVSTHLYNLSTSSFNSSVAMQFILDVAFTIIGEPFSQFIKDAVDTRNSTLAERQNLNIAIDPEIL